MAERCSVLCHDLVPVSQALFFQRSRYSNNAVDIADRSMASPMSRVGGRKRCNPQGALFFLVALARATDDPVDDIVYLPPPQPVRSAWRLYVHEVPWKLLGIPDSSRRLYESMMAADPPPAHDEGGFYHGVVNDLLRLMPRWQPSPDELAAALAAAGKRSDTGANSTDDGPRFGDNVLFLLPLSPQHFCQAVEHGNQTWGTVWASAKGSIPASIQISMIMSLRNGMQGYCITCQTYA